MKRRSFLIGLPTALIAAKKLLLGKKEEAIDVGQTPYFVIYKSKDKQPQTVYSGHMWFVDNADQVEIINVKAADFSFINSVTFTSG